MIEKTVIKVLSANDTGETGGHQAGLLVPRKQSILSFFPSLDSSKKNPRAHLSFEDASGYFWKFAFIYYNNKLFGGTRNEYRLTRMTRYFRESGLVAGDEVIMHCLSNGDYTISYKRTNEPLTVQPGTKTTLKLGSGWKVIKI